MLIDSRQSSVTFCVCINIPNNIADNNKTNALFLHCAVCESGYYGPDCALQCHYCINQRCNPTNGACLNGCTVPSQCDHCEDFSRIYICYLYTVDTFSELYTLFFETIGAVSLTADKRFAFRR